MSCPRILDMPPQKYTKIHIFFLEHFTFCIHHDLVGLNVLQLVEINAWYTRVVKMFFKGVAQRNHSIFFSLVRWPALPSQRKSWGGSNSNHTIAKIPPGRLLILSRLLLSWASLKWYLWEKISTIQNLKYHSCLRILILTKTKNDMGYSKKLFTISCSWATGERSVHFSTKSFTKPSTKFLYPEWRISLVMIEYPSLTVPP